jgi:hypothetical protein
MKTFFIYVLLWGTFIGLADLYAYYIISQNVNAMLQMLSTWVLALMLALLLKYTAKKLFNYLKPKEK